MKLTKKLIPAIGMLTLSMVMLVTSSFAWFSMNDTVKATGMTVGAKGDQIYLQIIRVDPNASSYTEGTDDYTASNFIAGAAQTSVKALNASAKLLPSNVKKDSTSWGDYAGGSSFVWATAIGKDAVDGTATDGKYTVAPHSEGSEGNKYYLKNSFKMRLDETAGATTAPGPLRVSGVNFVEGFTAATGDKLYGTVSVLVVCGNQSQLYMQDTAGTFSLQTGSNDSLDPASGNFANTDGVQVDVYVFFNGDNPACTLANLSTAANNYPIEVSFTCSKVS